jgi:Ras-related protein Rab-2A
MSVSRTFKIIVVGEQGVGKSSLLSRYLKKEFHNEYNVTIGVEFLSRTLELPEGEACLQIWDTAGQETFRSIIKNFYRGASGVLLVFSLTNKDSLTCLRRWVSDI